MAVDYTNYSPELGSLAGYTPAQRKAIRDYFKKPRSYKSPYGLGFKLPTVGGLRIRRGQTTQFGKRDIITDQQGRVYGTLGAGSNLAVGRNAAGQLALIRRPASGGGGGGGGGGQQNPPKPPPDEYASYEKDYPWIATYLRGLRKQETDFNTTYQTKFEPNLRTTLENLARVGEGAADRYKALANAGTAAMGAAANVAPVQIASTSGVADPYALRVGQASASARADAGQATSSYDAARAALAPTTAGQGILRGIATQYASMSKAYADKRIEDRLKLDQWIEEQKAAAADRKIKQQYNMALLDLKEEDLNLDRQRLELDVTKANNEAATDGKFTGDELLTKGFRPVPPKAGPKSRAKIATLGIVTSTDGRQFYKPGRSGGGGGATGQQRQKTIADLTNAYVGNTTDQLGNVIGTSGGGIRSKASANDQAGMILSWVESAIRNGLVGKTAADVAALIDAAIPSIEYPQEGGRFVGIEGLPEGDVRRREKQNKQYIINLVTGSLRRRRVIK